MIDPNWFADELMHEHDACGVGFLADSRGRASHDLIVRALEAVTCLEHRGGCGADRDSGDGAGLLSAVPWSIIDAWCAGSGLATPDPDRRAVGMLFLPRDAQIQQRCRAIATERFADEGFRVVGWRPVPVRPDHLGLQAASTRPDILQVILESEHPCPPTERERKLYLARKAIRSSIDQGFAREVARDFHFASLSCRTIVYKGMVRSEVLGRFYEDLLDERFESTFVLYHRRFSTNTFPRWPLAQPLRLLGHNGEINTVLGNRNWMSAREPDLKSELWGGRIEKLKPILELEGSDSASLDNAFELLVRSGRDPLHSMMMLVPEAYDNQPALADFPEVAGFYQYHGPLQESWDGPALVVFSDGVQVGATLDRNGLRPARYAITDDGLVIVASEAGVVDVPLERVIEKGRLGPGQMIAVDLESGEILKNWDIKQKVSRRQPYREWVTRHRQTLEAQPYLDGPQLDTHDLLVRQRATGYTLEDVERVILPMAQAGKEPVMSMGDDTPLAVLSQKERLLYDYFKQRFAQVTNPPIDPIREGLVMSLEMYLGPRGSWLEEKPEFARLLRLTSPILNENQLAELRSLDAPFNSRTLALVFALDEGTEALEKRLEALCAEAEQAVRSGASVLILSDRALGGERATLPPLLAVGAIHHHLIAVGLRLRASLVVETAQCWSTHHFACLFGYGASAVCPYLAFETIRNWWAAPTTRELVRNGKIEDQSVTRLQQNYVCSVEAGILKILSKMGISLLSSYSGAQIFEAIGIGAPVIGKAFCGTISRVGGMGFADIAREALQFHIAAYPDVSAQKLVNYGLITYRPGGEFHINNPKMVKALHAAIKLPERAGAERERLYGEYIDQIRSRPPAALRDLLEFKSDRSPIALEAVESVESILHRFCTGGMSLGALGREAHEVLAIAMNRIGGKSNSGEGGEDPVRFKPLTDVLPDTTSPSLPGIVGLRNGDSASSAIKQVASGRFGVTPEYLASARQLEIKIAQGAKPGEGGQLPGHKVDHYIATLRRSKPGVSLISPPPHHDIYSIEDLAQLIFDLHQINPKAFVSVKLVAEVGIGTIAAGVAKANADVIQISGHEGGTGASPLSSIKHAGVPWELGLTEVHQVLLANQLRDRVTLRVDGGLRTGYEVVQAAMLGAEEYGFGSIAMIAEGCIMARVCHLNTCPKGVATQNPELRRRFDGLPEHVVNFFWFIAEEVRSLLASLGYRSLEEVMGRVDLLIEREVPLAKTARLDLTSLLGGPEHAGRDWLAHSECAHGNGPVLDDLILQDPEIEWAIAHHGQVHKFFPVLNTDRSVGARVSGRIAGLYGDTGFGGELVLVFSGSAGQSFGAFNLQGMTLVLTGEANDYVGKGMNGGEILIRPFAGARYEPHRNVIIGNTCLYGATGGALFANGQAGERFAVRNSLATAVVEGCGDHGCEYMTGGVVVVLGPVGRNFGAGMTGGIAYVFDADDSLRAHVNLDSDKVLQRVPRGAGEAQLLGLIQDHYRKTDSDLARRILENWEAHLPLFWQVVPPSEKDSPVARSESVLTPAE
ncbi:glutamate synthase-related protein [Gloeobacter violaceus]|uniref:glutamate synthase (ferredoxin) n=1 Tax=Gloeobacter violaceus (strain ATCC 29082 / PCC 7421) TaxID=251221 RepID=Q7NKH0_GLOVI|nr:glutamate synthase-related protein [Gloeobacter violaceus]BAC89449.1 ferredoxin-dependent glutamate synthase [Gloeobacter violaceus PCC 7421]